MALSTQMVPSSSSFPSSSNSSFPSSYDSFISFCGVDTRNGFVDHLYADFEQKGLIVFKDDKKLERGNSIRGELLKAIKQSQYAVVVISENFAFSKWCLIELDKIVECETEKRLKILPVFYRIDPSEVRNQKGIFAQAFAKHKEDPDVGERWRAWSTALGKVGNIAGWHVQPIISAEADVVKDITGIILCGVQSSSSKSFEGLVGIGSRVKELENELRLGMDDVRLIGIYGMPGIGKTTLVEALFKKVRYEFEASCFICCGGNKTICELHQQIVHEILGESNLKIWDPIRGKELLETRLSNKRIFIVLDDGNRNQLEQLIGRANWFGQGSRILVTSKNRQLLKLYVKKTYEVEPLGAEDALELFCWNAFKSPRPKPGYQKLLENIRRQVNGHPLAIKVIGSSLYDKREEVWIGVRDILKADFDGDILKKLEISYLMLGDSLKKYFLDIACFGGWFVNILKLLDQSSSLHIEALEDKSLINTRFGQVVMHDLLRKLGQRVVYQISPLEPGNRSRLWVNQDIVQVLKNDSGSEAIEGIVTEDDRRLRYICEVNFESFSKMTRLTVLIINFYAHIQFRWIGNSLKLVLSKELRVIQWYGFPLKSLPHNFESNNLVELSLPFSKIEVLCFGKKSFGQLKNIDLTYSKCLMEISDWSGVPNLEKLELRDCALFHKIHSSITNLGKLVYLGLAGCKRLKDDVTSSLHLVSRNSGIETDRPYSLKEIGSQPQSIGNLSWLTALTSLTNLDLTSCNLSDRDIPIDIRFLSMLENLNLTRNKFTRIPEGVAQLSNLKYLCMACCSHLQSLSMSPPSRLSFSPYLLSNLETHATHKCHLLESSSAPLFSNLSLSEIELDLSSCKLLETLIPCDLGCLSWAASLNLAFNKFTALPDNFFLLSNLEKLTMHCCSELRTLPKFSLSLRRLSVISCPLEMDYYQMDVRNIPLCMSVWFSVATKAGCDGTPYKILQLNPRHLSDGITIYTFERGDIFAWGPTLRYEIPSWFNNRSINPFPKIECHVDVDSKYEKMGLALIVAYQVHEHEDSNCCISGGTLPEFPEFVWRFQASGICKELPLVFHVPEVPLVGPNGFWAYIPIKLFERNGMNLDSCHSFKTSIETSNLKVEVKECGVRPVFRHDISEFFDILNSITSRGLELKKLEDFDFKGRAGVFKSNQSVLMDFW